MMHRWPLMLPGLLLMFGCGDSGSSSGPAAPSANVPFTITDLRLGNGARPVAGSPITVNYAGWLYDQNAAENKGQLFDQGQGVRFTYGVGAVIAGWDQGLSTMQVGGLRRLLIPPNLAYGSAGAGNGAIPPNATLVFDIELLGVP